MDTGIYVQFTAKDARKLLLAFLVFELCLTVIFFIAAQIQGPFPFKLLFNLDSEVSLAAWFSSIQLFLIGLLFLFSSHWPKRHLIVQPKSLLFIGAGFIFLSMDESAAFHEKVTFVLKHIEWIPRFKGDHGIWIPIYGSLLMILALVFYRTIKSILIAYPRQSVIMAAGLTILIIGGVGLEIVSYKFLRYDDISYLYLEVGAEEFLEMAGASLILYGALLCSIREVSLSSSD